MSDEEVWEGDDGEGWGGDDAGFGGDDAGFGDADGFGDDGDDGGWGDIDPNAADDDAFVDEMAAQLESQPSGPTGPTGLELFLAVYKQIAKLLRKPGGVTDKDGAECKDIMNALYADYEQTWQLRQAQLEHQDKAPDFKSKPTDECPVCMCPFDGADVKRFTTKNCGHDGICTVCYYHWVKKKIDAKEVTPWLECFEYHGEDRCEVPLHADDIIGCGLNNSELVSFCHTYLSKLLKRQEMWTPCEGKSCSYGFMLKGPDPQPEEKKCEVCFTKQLVKKRKEEIDDEFKKWIDEGKIRGCPVCKSWTMKEYGICNVINCQQCGIWWNWRNKETGNSSSEVKNKARRNGTLWEPGELEFQMKLQSQDPAKFKALLERNGIKYDPNYSRGSG